MYSFPPFENIREQNFSILHQNENNVRQLLCEIMGTKNKLMTKGQWRVLHVGKFLI